MNEQKGPWWSSFFGSSEKQKKQLKNFDAFELTKEQDAISRAISGNVVCSIDKKTNIIKISVKPCLTIT